jgi:hypothetical protein
MEAFVTVTSQSVKVGDLIHVIYDDFEDAVNALLELHPTAKVLKVLGKGNGHAKDVKLSTGKVIRLLPVQVMATI